jgi:uncharacterized protein
MGTAKRSRPHGDAGAGKKSRKRKTGERTPKSAGKSGSAGPKRKTDGSTRTTRPFEARRSRIQGRGVFATRDIARGTRLIEYTGERISEDEADERYPFDDEERHHTFLFRLEDGNVIDAGPRGSIAKYINHSCAPNCEAVEEDGRIFIDAIRKIPKGSELVYDYNFILDEPHTPANKRLYPCNCGSRKCRGTILARKR